MIFIGKGTYGEVFKVMKKDSMQLFAMKVSKFEGLANYKKKKNKDAYKRWKNAVGEIKFLSVLQHPSIITYKDSFFDIPTESLCLVMEFMNANNVEAIINAKIKKNAKMMEDAQNARNLEYNWHFDEAVIWKCLI